MADASIILNAKNNASAVLQQAGKDMKEMADTGDKTSGALKGFGDAAKKAMAGDFVGAAKSATGAWKALCAAMVANPISAVVVAVAALTTAVIKGISEWNKWTEAVKKAHVANREFLDSVDAVRRGGLSPTEQLKKDASAAVESGDREWLEKRLASLNRIADKEAENAKKAQADLLKEQTTYSLGMWESTKEAFGASTTRDKKIQDLTGQRDTAKQDLDKTMAQIKLVEEALATLDANEAKAAADKAAADKKAADDAERRAKKAADDAQKKADAEKKAAQDAADDAEKTYQQLAQKKAEMEKAAADKAKDEWIKAMKEAAAQEQADAENAVKAATEAWSKSGSDRESKEARRADRRAAREAERDAKQQARQLERWEGGARDRRATAAHELDEARKAMEAAKEKVEAAAEAAKQRDAEKAQEQIAKLEAIRQETEQAKEEMKALKDALVG